MLFPIRHTIWYSLKIPRFDLYCLSERKKSSYETLQLRLIDSVKYILNLQLSPTGRTSKYQVTISQNFDNFFALNGSYCRSRLKNEVYMHIWLVCCGSIQQLISPLALRVTWVSGASCLLWHYSSIDIFFRFEPAILSLTLKERRISVYLACLSWKYP